MKPERHHRITTLALAILFTLSSAFSVSTMVLCIEQDGRLHLKICNHVVFDHVNNQLFTQREHHHDDDCPGCIDIALGDCDPEATTTKQSALLSPVVLITLPTPPCSLISRHADGPLKAPCALSWAPDLYHLETVRLLT